MPSTPLTYTARRADFSEFARASFATESGAIKWARKMKAAHLWDYANRAIKF